SASFNGAPVSWEGHREWFAAKLTDPDCVFLIATDDGGTPLGQIRFDIDAPARQAVLSVSVAPEGRGSGLGTALIGLASRGCAGSGRPRRSAPTRSSSRPIRRTR